MNNIIKYKDYCAKIEYSAEDQILFGKIEGIDDLITFEAESASEIKKEFILAVEDYLEYCKEIGKEPSKTYKGTFNVRVSPELHRQAAMYGARNGTTLNQTVERALQELVTKKETKSACAGCMLSENVSAVISKQITSMWALASKSQNRNNFNTVGRLQ